MNFLFNTTDRIRHNEDRIRHNDRKTVIAWLRELNSGIPQGKSLLCELNLDGGIMGECCLGVLARILNMPFTLSNLNYCRIYEGSSTLCNGQGLLKTSWGDYEGDSLASLNDRGMPFKGIAEKIREQWNKQFPDDYISIDLE